MPKRIPQPHPSTLPLTRAFLLAQRFERQKLGRRRKAASATPALTHRIDAEIAALKARLPSPARNAA